VKNKVRGQNMTNNDVEIIERLTRVEAQTTNNTTDIADLKEETKAINKIANSVEIMAIEMKGMGENITRIDNKVSGLTAKVSDIESAPVKTKAQIVDKVITILGTAVTTGVIAFLLTQVAPQIFS
jgi:archaellum component FlaC